MAMRRAAMRQYRMIAPDRETGLGVWGRGAGWQAAWACERSRRRVTTLL